MTWESLAAGVVIPINKPRQWSSFQVVSKIKGIIRRNYDVKKFKIGHAGTLDPLASGVLLVCVGKATKQIDALQQGEKTYSGTFVLGATTPCYDMERPIDCYYPFDHITPQLLEQHRSQFQGTIMQVPPIYSAVHIDGQRAYQQARNGEEAEPQIAAKQVTISQFEFTDFRPGDGSALPPIRTDIAANATQLYQNPQGCTPSALPQADFRITCSKGTYIRSIARDLGLALNSGAFLGALCREQVGEYSLAQCLSLDEVEDWIKA